MAAKQDDSRSKRKGKPDVPSTGRGAASAMDALIKKRVLTPGNGIVPQQPQSKKR
jgi:hypothetical protein